MEGDLSTFPLADLLELLHSGGKSGRLHIRAEVPFELLFEEGEIVGGGVLDWQGFEAISAFDFNSREGRFRFVPGKASGALHPIMPFSPLLTEWARISDEWRRYLKQMGPPSRLFEAPRPKGLYEIFERPLSIRGAARRWQVPLIIAMERVWQANREGALVPLARYRWYTMRIRHPNVWDPLDREPFADVIRRLTGDKNLGELIAEGLSEERVRDFLIREILQGRLKPKGRGALLRDLTWERMY